MIVVRRNFIVFICGVVLLGCATMFTGTTKSVFIDTQNRKEIQVRLEKRYSKYIGVYYYRGEKITIPKTVTLKRGEQYRICSANGDNSTCMKVDRTFNPVFLVNIIFGGVIGFIVDGASGAVFSFDDTYVYVWEKLDNSSTSKNNFKMQLDNESKKK